MKLCPFWTILLLVLLASCRTSKDTVTYFQDLGQSSASGPVGGVLAYGLKIAPDDQLSITVAGVDPNSVAVFNIPLSSYLTPGQTDVTTTPVLHTYLVDARGDLDFPVLGKIHVAGMTRSELTEHIAQRLRAYVKDPIVTVEIRNFKVAVLGEVAKPGTMSVPGERLSVLDAIGMAGDLTIYGNRKNVLLIRDNGGQKEYHRFDLTSSATLESPYYYLQQNDILYVTPNKTKAKTADISSSTTIWFSVISSVVSLATLVVAITR